MKIYLAGPDVFRKDANAYFKYLKSLALKYSIEALSPFDSELNTSSAKEIFEVNVKIIGQVDAIFANIIPFRGANVDDGTAFEIGYGFANGQQIYGYSELASHSYSEIVKLQNIKDNLFPHIESFNYPCNLMIAEAIHQTSGKIFTTFEQCLVDFSQHHNHE